MSGLMVNFESLPKRCDVCHQSDCFDASRNLCSRCASAMEAETVSQSPRAFHMSRKDIPVFIGIISGAFIGLMSNFFVDHTQTFSVITGLALVGGMLGLIASSGLERLGDGEE